MSNALAAADELLTPIPMRIFRALKGWLRLCGSSSKYLIQVRTNVSNWRDRYDDVRCADQPEQQVVADVRKHFGDRVYETVIPRSVR